MQRIFNSFPLFLLAA